MCVQVELYMAELYNKVGVGLMTWSPVSLGLALGSREEQLQVFTKLAVKVHTTLIVLGESLRMSCTCCALLKVTVVRIRIWGRQICMSRIRIQPIF